MSRRPEQPRTDRRPQAPGGSPRPEGRRRAVKRGPLIGAAVLSTVIHASLVLALFWARTYPARALEPRAVSVELVDERRPVADQIAPAPARPSPAKPPSGPKPARPALGPAPTDIDTPPAADSSEGPAAPGLSNAQLAGAVSADSGPTGRACDMARRLQSALRKDPLVQAAVAQARQVPGSSGEAIMVWNGDWVRSGGEDGKGLAAVREAMMWEIAFAPQACRAQSVRGLVLISPSQTPGSARLAVGSADWRWSDLLGPRGAGSSSWAR